mmetsp:Transcript_58136/g.186786  ORF Transcript_58136/g.186786 Transcript_58136/m.186786 type:complete len:326 (-) Transcript_58136:812-1789(-)
MGRERRVSPKDFVHAVLAEHKHLRVGQRGGLPLPLPLPPGDDKVLVEDGRRHQDEAAVCNGASVYHAEAAPYVGEGLLPREEPRHEAGCDVLQHDLRRLPEIAHALEVRLGDVEQQRRSQQWGKLVCDLGEVEPVVVGLGFPQVLPVHWPFVRWHMRVRQGSVQQVCACLKVSLHGVAIGDDAAHAADDEGPEHAAGQHADHGDEVLLEAHGHNVAVTYRGDGHHRPMQRGGVNVEVVASAVRRGLATDVEGGDPRHFGQWDGAIGVDVQRGAILVAEGPAKSEADEAPDAGHPVRADDEDRRELDELLCGKLPLHGVLPPLDEP